MNQKVIATIGALLIGTAIISGCGSEKQSEDTSLKVRTITIGEESGTTSAGYAGTIHNKTETNLAFKLEVVSSTNLSMSVMLCKQAK